MEEPPLKARCWDAPSKEHTAAAVEVSSLCAQKSPGASQQQGRQCLRPSSLAFKQQCSACGPCNRHRACANQTLQSPAQFGHLNGPPQISDMRQRAKSAARKCLAGRTVLSLLRGAFIFLLLLQRASQLPLYRGSADGRSLEG